MNDQDIVPVAEELLRVEKRDVVTGRVRVETVTELAEETATANLRVEFVEVKRVPVNREVDRAPEIRVEGDVTIVPVLEEILVIEKRLVLKEELHLVRHTTHETHEMPVQLRKQRVVVSRLDEADQTSGPIR